MILQYLGFVNPTWEKFFEIMGTQNLHSLSEATPNIMNLVPRTNRSAIEFFI